MLRKKNQVNRWYFYLMQIILITLAIYWFQFGDNKKIFKIGVIGDLNQTEIQALYLYQKRLNKYGGIDNTELELIFIGDAHEIEKDFTTTINIKHQPYIRLTKERVLAIDKHLEYSHLNYRMSSVVSDCKRKYNKVAIQKAIDTVKALDIVIESLPERLDNGVEYIKEYLKKSIPKHRYFKEELKEELKVSVGVAMHKITNIDLTDLTYDMDFYLWFRWDGDTNVTVDDIEFINTMTPTLLLEDNVTSSILSKNLTVNEPHYKRWRIKASFKALEYKNYALGEQNLPIRFRHKILPTTKIHYIQDETDVSNGLFLHSIPQTTKAWEKARFDVVDNPSLYLHYTLVYSTFGDSVWMGNPVYFEHATIPTSEYTMRFAVKHVLFSIRGIEGWINSFFPAGNSGRIHKHLLIAYILMSLFFFNWLTHIQRVNPFNRSSNIAWGLKLAIIMLLLLCVEFLLSQYIFEVKLSRWGVKNLDIIETIMLYLNYSVAILGWVIPAYYVVSAFNQFLWNPIEEKTDTEIPSVLRMFVAVIVYALTIVGIMAYVFEVTSNSLMATSGAFAILFAIASKVDISNIVAGLGISFAKIFKLGDWVKIDGVEGQVVEMTPRSTKVLTFDNSIVNIPNTNVGGAIIENMAHPTTAFRLMIHLEIVPMDYTVAEQALLEGVKSVGEILREPKPFIAFLGQGDSAQIFEVYFYIEDYSKRAYYHQLVWRAIWSSCEKHKLVMSTPQREHFNFDMSRIQ